MHTSKHTTNKTRVKIVCYYSHRKCGTPYTVYEMKRGMNRKPHDIYEQFLTDGGKWKTDERAAIEKAKNHLQKHKANIITALIFVNVWVKDEEWLIAKYHRDYGLNFPKEPVYTPPDARGNIFIKSVTAITKSKMRKEVYDFSKHAA